MLNKLHKKRKTRKMNKMKNSKNNRHKIPSRMKMNRETNNTQKPTRTAKKTNKIKTRQLVKLKTRKNTAKVFYSSFLFMVASSSQSSS